MKVIPKDTLVDFGNRYEIVPQYEATQRIENGLLSYVKVTKGKTATEAIIKIMKELRK